MQEMTTNAALPVRFLCGGCQHWEEMTLRSMPEGEPIGRCGRFSESRASTSRPRCNICWEPRPASLRAVPPVEND